jgi:hypothetical protein
VGNYLRFLTGSSLERSKKIAQILAQREPLNPFFRYLNEGPSENLQATLLNYCPQSGQTSEELGRQWAWERSSSEEAWRVSMGWDCVFMANLLLKNLHP